MFCSKCGATVAEGVPYCPNCGQATGGVSPSAAAPAYAGAPVSAGAAAAPGVAYAGFWLRFVAWIIDRILLQIVGVFLLFPLFGVSFFRMATRMPAHPNPEDVFPLFASLGRVALAALVLHWLYYALLESSAWQATLGKKALGLQVTDLANHRITFARATGRYFSKIISDFTLLIGYIMAGFTAKKQALHDIIAGTLVIKQIS